MDDVLKHTQRSAPRFFPRHVLPVVLLLFSLAVTVQLWRDAVRVAEQSQQSGFVFRAREMNERILQRLHSYEDLLRGTAGLYAASVSVERDEFRAYVDALQLRERYPGLQGIGYMLKLQPGATGPHEDAVRKEGFPNYRVWPEEQPGMRTAVIYLEPFIGRNAPVLGYDAYTEPVRRGAMLYAMESGDMAISGKVRLVQETEEDVQAGFVMYLPVYRNGVPHETLEERRANLVGWVYAPFRMNNLMRAIHGFKEDDLDIEIYDGDSFSRAALMYDSNLQNDAALPMNVLRYDTVITLGNHHWTMVITVPPELRHRIDYSRARLILSGGIGISILLSLLAWGFMRDRARALQAAEHAYRLALYDMLTGLPNRQLAIERLSLALAHARRNGGKVALLFVDLDRFKPVNDQFGHAVGDLLLKSAARRLKDALRESDTAARVGGDEFVVLLPDVKDSAAAGVVAEKILHAMVKPFEIAGHRLEIAASIGVALYPDDAEDEKALFLQADLAMYRVKSNGRNAVCFARP